MRTLTTVLLSSLFFAFATPAFATPAFAASDDEAPGLADLRPHSTISDDTAQRSAHTLEVTGGVLTGVGVLTEIATIALFATSHFCIDSCSRTPDEERADQQQWNASIATAVIAPVLMIAGITTWAVGANRRKALHRINRDQPTLTLTAGGLIGQF